MRFVRKQSSDTLSGFHAKEPERTGRHRSMFPDPKEMKEQMRAQMVRPDYDVAEFYKEKGFCQWIARHGNFEKMTLVVIGLNAIWIGVDTDFNHASVLLDAQPVFQIAEHAFCTYFLFEWTMRFGSFKVKYNGLRDTWFVFDSLLVSTMVIETWAMPAFFLIVGRSTAGGALSNASILRIARLLRLTRMARMARLLRTLPELLILIKGMMGAMRSVALTLGLLVLILYVFAVAFTQLCADADCAATFDGVLSSMHLLLVNGALMDSVAELIDPLMQQSIFLLFIFYFYLLLAGLTIMNMLIGVICEVVSAVAATEREAMSLAFVNEKIQELIDCGDGDDDNAISKSEFLYMLKDTHAQAILTDVGIDVVGLVDFADFIFEPENVDFLRHSQVSEPKEKSLSFSDFMKIILDMRGSNTATVRDIVDLRKFVKERIIDLGMKLDMRLSTCYKELANTPRDSGEQSRLSSCKTTGGFRGIVDSTLNALLTAHEQEVSVLRAENFRLRELLENLSTVVTPRTSTVAADPIKLEMHVEGAVKDLVHGSVTSSTDGYCQEDERQPGKFREIPEFKQVSPGTTQVCDGHKRLESSLALGDAPHPQISVPEPQILGQLPRATLRDAATAASAHRCRFVPSDIAKDSCWGLSPPGLRPAASYAL